MLTYKEYLIERLAQGPKRWTARITRADGHKLRVVFPASEHPFLETKAATSAEEAEELAKRGIDFGAIV
jgi:hypothetical protein